MDMDYEWDEAKNFSNFLKHHIRFEDAVLIFKDLHALEMTDDESSTEIRIIRIGLNPYKGVLVVIYCERLENIIRLISARRSTFRERIEYEKRI